MDLGLGPWAASRQLFECILKNIPFGANVLELGSGSGTNLLGRFYTVRSIEHDEQYLHQSKRSIYFHAPLTPHENKLFPHHTQWYDPEVVREAMKGFAYDVLLVDGPPGMVGRSGFLTHIEMFDLRQTMVLLDDVDRQDELNMAVQLLLRFLPRPDFTFHILPGRVTKRFALLLFGEWDHLVLPGSGGLPQESPSIPDPAQQEAKGETSTSNTQDSTS
ncbi:hypothetical protein GF324_02180 [bacterium]|nr:hypothetical protein [bacterium]